MPVVLDSPVDARGLRVSWTSELERLAARQDWGLAIMTLGWVHFAYGCFRQWLELTGRDAAWAVAGVWAAELAILLLAMSLISGRLWFQAHPGAAMLWQTWGCCILVGAVVAAWNLQTGPGLAWYKPALAALGALAFAAAAWQTSVWLLLASVGLLAGGCLMILAPPFATLIDSAAWWTVAHAVGAVLCARRSWILARPEPARFLSGVRIHIPLHHKRHRQVR